MADEKTPQAIAYEEYFGGISKLMSFRRDNHINTYDQSMPVEVEPQIEELGVANTRGYESVPRSQFRAAVDAALHSGKIPEDRVKAFPGIFDEGNIAYFLASDMESGFSVDCAGMISHMFNVSEHRGLSWNILIEAIRHGGCYLFCPNGYHLINDVADLGFLAVAKCSGYEFEDDAWANGHIAMGLLRGNCMRAGYNHKEHEDMPIPTMKVEDADDFLLNLMALVGA